jgi:hypothetical protein
MMAESSNEKFNIMQNFAEIRKEHNKFITILDQKHVLLSPIVHWLNTGNIRAALSAIEKQSDPAVLADLVNMVINSKKIDTINIEFATTLLKKSELLIFSSYIVHIKTAMNFVSKCVSRFKNVGCS